MKSLFVVVLTVLLISSIPCGAQIDTSFVVRGVKLHYTDEGKGSPVVLIHGLYSSIAMNWRLPGVIGSLKGNYRVIALDLPGHGSSDKPTSDDAYGLAMVEDVVALMDHLKIPKAHIVGYSMGGMIAMKFMALHQDKVISAVVGGMGWLKEGSMLQKFWERIPTKDNPGGTPSACPRSLGKLALTEAEVKAIRVPVEIIVGDRDPVKRMYVAPLQKVRTDWPVINVPGAGHLNCITKPEFQEGITKWLDAHRG